MRFAALALLLAACSDPAPALRPIVATPPADSAAYPYAAIDELVLSIARAGDEQDLALATVPLGEELALGDVPFGDELVVHLSGRVGGLEVAYGRTCPVAVTAEEGADVPEPALYFSRVVRWGPGPALSLGDETASYVTPAGEAVVVSGSSAALFDPYAGAFRPLELELAARSGATLTPVGDGRAAVRVGGVQGGAAVDRIEMIVPAERSARTALDEVDRSMSQSGPALSDHAAVRLVDGSVLVTGGQRPGGAVVDEAWIIAAGPEGLEPIEAAATRLGEPRAGHTMTRLRDEPGADVLLVGGRGVAGAPVGGAELYRPLQSGFQPAGASLTMPRWDHRAVRLPGGFVLVLGGLSGVPGADPIAVRELELYDPVLGTFTVVGTLPAAAGLTELAVTPLPDGRILLTGGRDLDGAPVATALIARFDPIDGQVDVIDTDSLAAPRAGHSAVLLCDGTVLVTGGGAPPERYNPPSAGRR